MIKINFVAQSGYAWVEEYETLDAAKAAIPSVVGVHGDIERAELLDEDDLLVDNLWVRQVF